ncbi:MAG: Lrp/AsnC family transcriptional regulator [Gemmobacter sp.]
MEFSEQDRRILRALQRDAAEPLGRLAERLGMAQSTLWRRIQALDASGVIRGRVALLDPGRAGAGMMVLVQVHLSDHSEASVAAFAALVNRCPEILECQAVTGGADYHLKVRVPDVAAYEAFMSRNLLRAPQVRSVTSSIVLREIKATTELPL